MGRFIGVALLLSLATAQASTAEHLVSEGVLQEQLAEVARERGERIAVINAFLDTPEAAHASGVLGVSVPRVKREMALLTNSDLRDLSLRAEALRTDPSAGSSGAAWAPVVFVMGVVAFLVLLVGYSYASQD